jgi:hypothetical protein
LTLKINRLTHRIKLRLKPFISGGLSSGDCRWLMVSEYFSVQSKPKGTHRHHRNDPSEKTENKVPKVNNDE